MHKNKWHILCIIAKLNTRHNNSLTLFINLYIIKINQERLIKINNTEEISHMLC